jgi:hypothetical protein
MVFRFGAGALALLWPVVVFSGLLLTPLAADSQDYGDTPYVPTPQHVVEKMLEVAKVNRKDYVIDLGSGDGRMIITAAKKYGARGFGVDLDRALVEKSNMLAKKAGVADRAVFYARDLYETDLSPATVLTIYLLPEVNLMVRGKLLATLKPGTRIVSHDYDMGEWRPDLSMVLDAPDKPVGADKKSKVFYWLVPAAVSGKWRWQTAIDGKTADYELDLSQMFQTIEGALAGPTGKTKIGEARITGTRLSFAAVVERAGEKERHFYSGEVGKQGVTGTVTVTRGLAKREFPWKAKQVTVVPPRHVGLKPPPPPAIQ